MAKETKTTGARAMPFQPYLGGFILETLTLGMYGEAQNAIREYLQNGFDAVRKAVRDDLIQEEEGMVELHMEDDRLVLLDNGCGLAKSIAIETLTSIGASRKDYRREAGFRGIGRLAGIAFCNELRFRTKAAGEDVETEVTFAADGLRRDMSPSTGSQMTLAELLESHVEAVQRPADADDPSFFEVVLEGFVNAPVECTDRQSLRNFVSQVAPVPYAVDFPFRSDLIAAASKSFGGIETVRVKIIADGEEEEVFKDYGPKVSVGKTQVDLVEKELFRSPSKKWWGWIGFKAIPGSIRDESIKGVRIRVRNIQIDGTQIFGKLFDQIPNAKSYRRFNDWYVGEIFVDPTALVPNARRDGFEDDVSWRVVQNELVDVCKKLGQNAYNISTTNQASLRVLASEVKDLEGDAKSLLTPREPDVDKVMALSTRVNKLHRNVTRAFKSADFELQGQLRSLENKLLDVKTRAIRKLGVTQMKDADELQEEARQELLQILMEAFKERLEMKCYREVRKVVKSVAGYEF